MIKQILVVDDDIDFLSLIEEMLALKGFNVQVAHSGMEGIGLVKENKYDLILSDISMKDGDGYYFLEEYKKIHQHGPPFFVFVTGLNSLGTDELLNKGAKLVIQKPFSFDFLLNEISKLDL